MIHESTALASHSFSSGIHARLRGKHHASPPCGAMW